MRNPLPAGRRHHRPPGGLRVWGKTFYQRVDGTGETISTQPGEMGGRPLLFWVVGQPFGKFDGERRTFANDALHANAAVMLFDDLPTDA